MREHTSMGTEAQRDSSNPPPLPRSAPSDPYREPTREIATEARDLARGLKETLGEPPDPSTNRPGSGMAGVLAEIRADLKSRADREAAEIDKQKALTEADRQRKEKLTTVGKAIAGVIAAAGTAVAIAKGVGH